MKISCVVMAGAAVLSLAAGPCVAQLAYHIDTVAGGGQTAAGPPSAALSGDLLGIAVDRWGNLYFTDTDHQRVCRLTAGGVLTTVAGTGYQGFDGDGGPATAATLNFPYGLAVDALGNLYIADLGNERVRRVGLDGLITTVAGAGQAGSQGDGGKASAARLVSPRNVAIDAAGNLYISEFKGHRVRRVALDGSISTVAGTGAAGFRGDGGVATAAQLAYPAGLAIDAGGNLYIADSQNLRVRKVAPNGLINTVLGGAPGDPMPTAVATDAAANLYVADQGPVIRQLLPSGQVTFVPGFTVAHDLALDSGGNLYLADGHHILRRTAAGQVQLTFGDLPIPFPAESAAAALVALDHPASVAADSQGNVYLADAGSNRIRKVTPQGAITTVAGLGLPGFGGDGGPAGTALLNNPTGLAMDASGRLLITDTGNHLLRQLMPAGWILTLLGTGTPPAPLNGPRGVAGDPAGNVYVADTLNNRILRVASSGLVTVLAGNGAPGASGDGGPAILAQLNGPVGLSLDPAGNLFIADTGNHRLRKVDVSGTIRTIAGTGIGDDVLRSPAGVAVDAAGEVMVADTGNHRIRVVLPDGSIRTVAGTGVPGFSGDGAAALGAQLNSPLGLAWDAAGNLLVADSGNGRIRRLIPDAGPPAQIQTPGLSDATIVNAASLRPGPIAAGEIISIFASNIGPDRGVRAQLNSFGMLDTILGDVQVSFDGRPGALFYVQSGQINVQVPYSIAGQTSVQVEVQYQGVARVRTTAAVAVAVPGLMTVGGGTGQVLAINEDNALNSESNPAARSSVVTLFATGEGQISPPGVTGEPAEAPYPRPIMPVSLRIGGNPAEILFAGSAPGFVGLLQLNARVPSGFVPIGDLAVELTIGSVVSQPGVTIAVK